jgi:hypothetical protein
MPDEHQEKVVRLLEEIRDLTRKCNQKLDGMEEATRYRAVKAQQRIYVALVFAVVVFFLFVLLLRLMAPIH